MNLESRGDRTSPRLGRAWYWGFHSHLPPDWSDTHLRTALLPPGSGHFSHPWSQVDHNASRFPCAGSGSRARSPPQRLCEAPAPSAPIPRSLGPPASPSRCLSPHAQMELGVMGKDMMLGERAAPIPSPQAGDAEVLSPLGSALCSVA